MSKELFEAFRRQVNIRSADTFTTELKKGLTVHFPALSERQLEILTGRAYQVIWLTEERGQMHEYINAYYQWEADVIQALGPLQPEEGQSMDDALSVLQAKIEPAYAAAVQAYESYRAPFDAYVIVTHPQTGEVRYMSDLPPEV